MIKEFKISKDKTLNKSKILNDIKNSITLTLNKELFNHNRYMIPEEYVVIHGKEEYKISIKNMKLSSFVNILKSVNIGLHDIVEHILGEIKCIVCDNLCSTVKVQRRKIKVYKVCDKCIEEKLGGNLTKRFDKRTCEGCGAIFFKQKREIYSGKKYCSRKCFVEQNEKFLKEWRKENYKHWTEFKTEEEKRDIYARIIENRKEAVQKSFENGRIPWNKDKKMEQWYCDIQKEASKKFWESLPPDKNLERREKCRQTAIKNLKKGSYKQTSIERKIEELLTELQNTYNFEFKYSFIFKNKQFDFLVITEFSKILIECHGDYWHCNENCKNFKGFSVKQKEFRRKDIIKENIAIENNYIYLSFWETDINQNIDVVKKEIEDLLL